MYRIPALIVRVVVVEIQLVGHSASGKKINYLIVELIPKHLKSNTSSSHLGFSSE